MLSTPDGKHGQPTVWYSTLCVAIYCVPEKVGSQQKYSLDTDLNICTSTRQKFWPSKACRRQVHLMGHFRRTSH